MITQVAIELIDPTQVCLRSGEKPNVILKLPDLAMKHFEIEEIPAKLTPMLTAFQSVMDVMNVTTGFIPETAEIIVTLIYETPTDSGSDSITIFKPVDQMHDIPTRLGELL